jgi:hypothetical protein
MAARACCPARARMRSRICTLVLACALAGCVDVATLAEPPLEPTIWSEGADPADGLRFAGVLEFEDGLVITERLASPARPGPGERLRASARVTGLAAGTALWVGLRAPRAAGRQEVAGQSRRAVEVSDDPRDVWAEASVVGEVMEATLELPREWHAEHAVLVIEPRRGTSPVRARTGPRIDRGPGVFAVVPVATRPRQVIATQVGAGALTVDGRIEEAAWAERPALLLAGSLDGEPDPGATAAMPGALGEDALQPGRGTTLRLAWDPEFLYVAASLPDADLWTEYTAQDEPLYRQEAFEFFVAATGEGSRYLEYQVSARGVTFDARFPRYRAGEEAWDSSWRTAVAVWGTLDVGGDRDRGWSVEAAIPWTELCEHTELRCPPAPGMRLRVNAFRLERPDRKRSEALALSPTRAPDFHAWANAAELELQ